jgi:hypothetical protein
MRLISPRSDLLEERREVRRRGLIVGADQPLREEREHHDDEDGEGCALEKPAHESPRSLLAVQRRHVGQVAVPFGVVHPYPMTKRFGISKPDVLGPDLGLSSLPAW